jgi:hypothetical protein
LSELAELYVLFLVLYLFECLAWVPRRTVGFFALLGRWRGRAAFRPNAGWSVSVVFGKPWPPLSPPWLAEPLPMAIDPSGITLIESDGRRLAWEELGRVSARGHRVECGERLLATLASRVGASALAETLEKARTLQAKKRENHLRKFLDARFDADAPLDRVKAFRSSVRALRVCSNALWLSLFGGLGVAVFTHSTLVLLAAAALSLLLWPVNSVVFFLTLRKLPWLPHEHRPELSKRLVALLSPISGVRGVDMLAREVWANLDPMTVATALLSPGDLPRFARPFLVAMHMRENDDLAWWHAESRQRLERVLARKDVDLEAMLAPPARESERAETYCPSCLAQFEAGRRAGELCPNEGCSDVPLRAFDPKTPCPTQRGEVT